MDGHGVLIYLLYYTILSGDILGDFTTYYIMVLIKLS